jgi:hypothetical protein
VFEPDYLERSTHQSSYISSSHLQVISLCPIETSSFVNEIRSGISSNP